MQRSLYHFMLVIACVTGCALTVPVDTIAPQTDRQVETIFTCLADAIDNPELLPKNTTQLELMIRHLRTVQAINDEQVAKLKQAVDCSKETELTKSHSAAIRGLK